MKSRVQLFKKQLEALSQMQKDHLAAFEADLLPDLEQQSVERKKAFDKFKIAFQQFTEDIYKHDLETSPEIRIMVERCLDDVNALIDQNRMLKIRVTEFRNGLKESMINITTGKKSNQCIRFFNIKKEQTPGN